MSGSTIEHVVRWWLRNPGDPAARGRFHDVVAKLAGLPGVTRLTTGTPTDVAWNGPDQTFDVGFIVTFESFDAVTGYMAHPLHQDVVDLAGELAARIDVFYLTT